LKEESFDGGKTNLKKVNAYQEFWHSWQTFNQKIHFL
jgi:hypothetical protein